MKTPVIIPAYNEEANIERTLRRLPADTVEPIVAVNGSTDQTAAIAERFGAEVQIMPEQGKMPAIQRVLEGLGDRALEPLLILDADAPPIFPHLWRNQMVSNLSSEDKPAVVGGPVFYTGRPIGTTLLRTLYRAGRAKLYAHDEYLTRGVQFGPSMGLKAENQHTLNKVMEIPNFWPGEDRAIVQTVLDAGGVYSRPVHPYAFTFAPASISSISLVDRLRLGAERSRQVVEQRYMERGAPGSIPYQPELNGQVDSVALA